MTYTVLSDGRTPSVASNQWCCSAFLSPDDPPAYRPNASSQNYRQGESPVHRAAGTKRTRGRIFAHVWFLDLSRWSLSWESKTHRGDGFSA
jgi:hypothetical protein